MEKQLFADYPAQEREALLKDNADKIEEKGYMKAFTPDEIMEKKDSLAKAVISISNIQQEKKDANDGFKTRLKPLEIEKSTLLEEIKNKAEYVEEDCYKFIDQEAGTVRYYNSNGELVESRPIRADEKQTTIFQLQKTVNN